MGAEELKAKFRRVIDELWNKGNVDVVDELYAPHCAFHNPNFPVEGVAGLKEQVQQLRAAIPDLHFDMHEIIIDGDLAASRWTMGGTPRGEFRGLPAHRQDLRHDRHGLLEAGGRPRRRGVDELRHARRVAAAGDHPGDGRAGLVELTEKVPAGLTSPAACRRSDSDAQPPQLG